MIKASARAHDGRHLVVLGLSEENIRRMRHGQPIYFETTALHIPANETIGRVVVFYGTTEDECLRTIRTLIGPTTRIDAEAVGPKEPQ
jgi:hypothetical protein